MNATFRAIGNLKRDGIIARYAVTGAVAAFNYIEPTMTADLDILISVEEIHEDGVIEGGRFSFCRSQVLSMAKRLLELSRSRCPTASTNLP